LYKKILAYFFAIFEPPGGIHLVKRIKPQSAYYTKRTQYEK